MALVLFASTSTVDRVCHVFVPVTLLSQKFNSRPVRLDAQFVKKG